MAGDRQSKRTAQAPRSEAQRDQARINGAKSRGPKTEAGKAVSRENAITHGFTGNLIVGKKHRKKLNLRIKTFEAEAGPRAMHQGLAGFAAIAMTRAEVICESRHKTAERNCRRIQRREQHREAKQFEEGQELLAQGQVVEGLARLAEVPAGCLWISDCWSRLDRQAQAIGEGQIPAPELWEELDRLRSTIPPDDRPRLVAMIRVWRKTPEMAAPRIARLAGAIANEWDHIAQERRVDLDQDLDARMANARADLSTKGQARERYFNKAHAIYRNAVQQIDNERRHRDRMQNEPEKSSQGRIFTDLMEIDTSDQTAPKTPSADTDSTDRRPIEPMRNEPEKSSQDQGFTDLKISDKPDQIPMGGSDPSADPEPANPGSIASWRNEPEKSSQDQDPTSLGEINMPDQTLITGAINRGRRRPRPGHPWTLAIVPTLKIPYRRVRPSRSFSSLMFGPDPAPEIEAKPTALATTPREPSARLTFEEEFGHLDPSNLKDIAQNTAEMLAYLQHLPGFQEFNSQAFLDQMRAVQEQLPAFDDSPIEIDDAAQYWADRGNPFRNDGRSEP